MSQSENSIACTPHAPGPRHHGRRVPDNAADGAWRQGVSHVSHVTLDTLLTLVRARAGPRDVQRDQGDHCHEPHHGSRGCRAGQHLPPLPPCSLQLFILLHLYGNTSFCAPKKLINDVGKSMRVPVSAANFTPARARSPSTCIHHSAADEGGRPL